MKKFSKVVYSCLTNADHGALNTQAYKRFVKANFVNPKLRAFIDAYTIKRNNEEKALKKIIRSAKSGHLAAADKSRDNVTLGFFDANKSLKNHYDPEVVMASEFLDEPLKTYGREVVRKNYKAQTELLSNMIEDLKSEKYLKHVEKTGLLGWVNEIEKQNDAFAELYDERNDDNAAKSDIVLKKARLETDDALDAVLGFIEALIMVEGEAEYADFVKKFNSMLSQYGVSRKPSKPNTDVDVPQENDKYPDAKEWLEDLPFMGVENGDIYYILVDEKKVFYKLIDKQKFFWHPESEKAAGGWEKLN